MTLRSTGIPAPGRTAWAALVGVLALLTACGGGSGGDSQQLSLHAEKVPLRPGESATRPTQEVPCPGRPSGRASPLPEVRH